MSRTYDEAVRLIRALVDLPAETPWLEFKVDNARPDMIGRLISAVSNSARLWGVRNADHVMVGTSFRPQTAKVGNQGLLNWLTTQVSPPAHLVFQEVEIDGSPMVLLEVPAASGYPTEFSGTAYLRLGEHTKALREHPRH